ncbi:hypothetical protein F4806DRAFT_156600 [Annulohypoxylon nitens]|nr:hypothetical protein F4806DRAFT_156600 [Annulohypoxylon nitens]
MTEFQPATFSSLPTELRLMIWQHALYQESTERESVDIYVDAALRSIGPMHRVVSPLLSTNRESREIAKAFYSFAFAVYRMPVKTEGLVSSPSCSICRSKVPLGQPAGVLRVNIERDDLVRGPLLPNNDNPSVPDPASCSILFDFDTKQTNRKYLRRTQHVRIVESYALRFRNWYMGHHMDSLVSHEPRGSLKSLWLFSRATEWCNLYPQSWGPSDINKSIFKVYEILSIRMIIEVDGDIVFELPIKGFSERVDNIS